MSTRHALDSKARASPRGSCSRKESTTRSSQAARRPPSSAAGRWISSSSARIGSRRTATPQTRSARTGRQSSRRRTGSRSTSAPTSTIDFDLASGDKIPIEERSPQEVLHLDGHPIAPKESPARNPAFDVTPAKYITGIITEEGIVKPGQLRSGAAKAPRKKTPAKKRR